MDALEELWWVVVMIGGPALIAVIMQKRAKRKEELESFDDTVILESQDFKNFQKIEEARNDFA